MICDYSKVETPLDYVCSVCGAKNVKLWRGYMACTDHIKLHCARCAALVGNEDISDIDDNGMHTGKNSRTDQIGNYIPAVPPETIFSFWGYTTVPIAGILWWRNLPTLTIPT
jgi:hypothetical protein